MESELIQSAASQGLWAVLFVALLLYVLKTNKEREAKLQDIIAKLSDKLIGIVDVIRADVEDIKQDMKEIKITERRN